MVGGSLSHTRLAMTPEPASFSDSSRRLFAFASVFCEGEGDVVGVKAPLGGVAQVIFHGVQVVEVGVQVRVHQDRGVEEDGEGQVEVEKGGRRGQRETHIYMA